MVPPWLHVLAIACLAAGIGCATIIATDEFRRPQHMWIMNVVWPVVALFGGVLVLSFYFQYGCLGTRKYIKAATSREQRQPPNKAGTPFPMMVAKGALHCGAGCTLGDILAETLAFFLPAVPLWFGWKALFSEKMFAVWILDYIFAFAIGIAFQYFTIKPMRQLSVWEGLAQALKADALSLTAWQVGMYGVMAIAKFYLFGILLNAPLETDSVEFWFTMQIAMIAGFVTSYPVNWWLITAKIKERM
ncbi:DUF4396 domain-containing protein [Pseudolabrys taiwanensis]|uniref:DUF4396 domain-containing protein n=1 Tax=Pseudolabrys taiwanensis TaxID=331696 RepID=A0A345ZZE2_9HYPH|nr:DUF4396 domain-containing protein [Pseudolabrys taiwanensis]AXK82289.1 DUF4396 domain-containing protein [Pseudolabrys taiwanensis]